MKALAIVFFLGTAIICGNASIIEHLFNNTHIRGGLRYNTSKGIDLGYDGKIVFDNGLIGVELMNLGANFKAVPKPGSQLGKNFNHSVDYSGNIHVSHGRHQADIDVNGTAGVIGEYEVNEDKTAGGYRASLSNENEWSVSADGFNAQGNSDAAVNMSGRGCRDGNKVMVEQRLRGGARTKGNVSLNGDNATFHILKFGEGGVRKRIFIYNQSGSNFFGHYAPSIAFVGEGGFKKEELMKWNKAKVHSRLRGGSMFNGLVWTDTQNSSDLFSQKIGYIKSADFGYMGKTTAGRKGSVLYGGVGTVGRVGGAELNFTNDGKNFSGGFGDLGDLHSVGIVKFHPRDDEDESKLEKELEVMKRMGPSAVTNEQNNTDEVDDGEIGDDKHHHRRRPIKTYVHARWAAGKAVDLHHNDDQSVDVNTRAGMVWDATGIDSKHMRPWHKHGMRGYNSSFEISPHNQTIRNIDVHLGHDAKMIDDLIKKYKNSQETQNIGW